MRKIIHQNSGITLLIISIFVLGIFIGVYIDFPFFKVKRKIDILQGVSILVTFWVAYYISNIVERANSKERVDKNLIIERVEKLNRDLEDFRLKVQSQKIKHTDTISFTKRFYLSVRKIADSIEALNSKYDPETHEEIVKDLKKLRNLLNYTDYEQRGEDNEEKNLRVQDGFIIYSENRVNRVISKLEDISNDLLKLQISVNRNELDS